MEEHKQYEVTYSDGVKTPACLYSRAKGTVVFGHGLDPARTDHLNDPYGILVNEACRSVDVSFLSYTARGHGQSTGWEDKDPSQFLWSSLSEDMYAVAARKYGLSLFIVSGFSMGSATALFCAMHHPENMDALILVRPPTAWGTRVARKQHLLNAAQRMKARNENAEDCHRYKVLEGAADANMLPISHPDYAKIVYVRCSF